MPLSIAVIMIGFWAAIKILLGAVQVFVEAWPFIKDLFTESPEEYANSIHEIVAELRSAKDAPPEKKRAAARAGARAFADHIKRL